MWPRSLLDRRKLIILYHAKRIFVATLNACKDANHANVTRVPIGSMEWRYPIIFARLHTTLSLTTIYVNVRHVCTRTSYGLTTQPYVILTNTLGREAHGVFVLRFNRLHLLRISQLSATCINPHLHTYSGACSGSGDRIAALFSKSIPTKVGTRKML